MATLKQLQVTLVKADKDGNVEDAAQLAEAIRQHPTYRKQGEDSLRLGFKGLSGKERRAAVQVAAAKAMGLRAKEVDVDNGMGLWDRTKLSLLKDDQSRMEYLEKKFGSENVSALNVKGDVKMFYRDPKSSKMTMVDEMGNSLADWTADLAGVAAPIAGAALGAVKGGAAGAPLGPYGVAAGVIGGAAVGGFGAGAAQDVTSEALAGQDIDLGEIAGERALEAAIGIPIDAATLGVGKIISRGFAGKAAREMIKDFDIAAKRAGEILAKEGKSLVQAPALRTGLGSKQASQIAAAQKNSKLARELQATRDSVGELADILAGKGSFGAPQEAFHEISEKIAQNYSKLVSELDVNNKALAKELRDQASRKMQKLYAPRVSERDVGNNVRRLLVPGMNFLEQTNRANFEALEKAQQGAVIPIKSILNAIKKGQSKFVRLKEPESESIFRELNSLLPEKTSIGFKEFREIMDEINGVISRNKEAGFSTKERVATQVFKELEDVRSNFLGDPKNESIRIAYQEAMRYYKDNLLRFKSGATGRILKERLANPSLTGEQISREIISDPQKIRQVLSLGSAELRSRYNVIDDSYWPGTPKRLMEQSQKLRKELQYLYLNRIGLEEGAKIPGGRFSFNDDIVRELWGDRQLRELKNLKERIIQSKDVKIDEISPDDLNKYLSALTGEERAYIYKMMREKAINRAKVDSLLNSTLIRKLLPRKSPVTGRLIDPEITGMGLADFSQTFINAPAGKVKRAMDALRRQNNPIGLQAFRQSYISRLFNQFKAGAQLDRFGNPLWNPVALERSMKTATMRKNAIEILGKEGFEDIMYANRILLEASETSGVQVAQIFQPRYAFSGSGLHFYGVGNLIGGLRGKVMAWAYSNRLGSAIMRMLVNPATDKEVEAMLKKILPLLMAGSKGIQAAAVQGQFDPEFTRDIAPLFESLAKEQQEPSGK